MFGSGEPSCLAVVALRSASNALQSVRLRQTDPLPNASGQPTSVAQVDDLARLQVVGAKASRGAAPIRVKSVPSAITTGGSPHAPLKQVRSAQVKSWPRSQEARGVDINHELAPLLWIPHPCLKGHPGLHWRNASVVSENLGRRAREQWFSGSVRHPRKARGRRRGAGHAWSFWYYGLEVARGVSNQLHGSRGPVVEGNRPARAQLDDHEIGDRLALHEVQIRRGGPGGACGPH